MRRAAVAVAGWLLVGSIAGTTLLAAAGPAAAPGLQALRHVALEARLDAGPHGLSVDALRRHAEAILGSGAPAPGIAPESPDRLRLTVAVRAHSASALRGFWLPLSGTYAIGPVRLEVERRVSLPAVPLALPAIVWQAERHVTGPWRRATPEILGRVDELFALFLADYRR